MEANGVKLKQIVYQLIAEGRDDWANNRMSIASQKVYRRRESAEAAREAFAKRCTQGGLRNIVADTLKIRIAELELED